jgi:hypothetical protein
MKDAKRTAVPYNALKNCAARREVAAMRKWAMRKWAALILLASLASPLSVARPAVTRLVTVDELEQALAHMQKHWDGRLAKQISDLKLTERLSAARLEHLKGQLPGSQSRGALIALADESAFLDLPASEIPSQPAPSAADQAALLGKAGESVKRTIDAWPNFVATRETTRYEGTATVIPGRLQDEIFTLNLWRAPSAANWECPGEPKIGYRRLTIIDRSTVAVVYRHGHELHALGEKGGEFECPENSVSTTEEFSRVVAWVAKVIAHGKISWGHWEQGPATLVAVFDYTSLVSYKPPAQDEVHGEIAIDPADGAILRLTQIRGRVEHEPGFNGEPAFEAPIEHDSEIDYGPVNIGGRVVWCPVRRIALYRTPILWPRGSDPALDAIYRENGLTESPLQEYLNDVTFTQYRLYGSS